MNGEVTAPQWRGLMMGRLAELPVRMGWGEIAEQPAPLLVATTSRGAHVGAEYVPQWVGRLKPRKDLPS